MYELIQAGENTWYVDCPTKIGIWHAGENNVYLIDSGNDKDAGRKVRQILDKQGWKLKGILNTHSHADHTGGNKYLQNNAGCKIFASPLECCFIEHPVLEPSYLFGGYAPKDLRHKFLMAQESNPVPFTDSEFPKEIEIIPLPGHYFEQVGFRTPDNVIFIADSLCSRNTLDKYAISVLYDVGASLATFDKLETLEAALFIPSHDAPAEDIKELVQYNRSKMLAVIDDIVAICGTPKTAEVILAEIFEKYSLTMTFEQYGLVGSTVRSYLAWMKDAGKLDCIIEENNLKWVAHHE